MRYLVFILALFLIFRWAHCAKISTLSEVWEKLLADSRSCSNCSLRKMRIEDTLSEVELRALRIEVFKKQLLDRLGITTPPQVTVNLKSLPKPLMKEKLLGQSNIANVSSVNKLDTAVEKTVIFPSVSKCVAKSSKLDTHLKVDLQSYKISGEIKSAMLWFHLNAKPKPSFSHNCSIIVKTCNIRNKGLPLVQRTKLSPYIDSWVQVDMAHILGNLLQQEASCFNAAISCEAKSYNRNECPISLETSYKPFILVSTITHRQVSKRHFKCHKGSTDCCMETLRVSFNEIGWDWILFPKTYELRYCHGNCSMATLIASKFYHSTAKKIDNHLMSKGAYLNWAPCCTPTKFSSMEISYYDKTVRSRIVPDVSVEACGCA